MLFGLEKAVFNACIMYVYRVSTLLISTCMYILIVSVTCIYISSVESQKGIIAAQRCSVENQKGAIAVQSQWQ